jgi:hypothetical protein
MLNIKIRDFQMWCRAGIDIFEGNYQPKSKQYSSWMAWTLELTALQTLPYLHNRYIPERPAQVWTVNYICKYKAA